MTAWKTWVMAGAMTALSASGAFAAPALNLEEFFNGHLSGSGYFDDQYNHERRTVTVDVRGSQKGSAFLVTEVLRFSDGEVRNHTWTFTKVGEGRYTGRRDDVIGTADVTQTGNEVRMSYKAHVVSKGTTHDLNFDETFVHQGADTIVNTTKVSLLFVTVGTGEATIRKVGN